VVRDHLAPWLKKRPEINSYSPTGVGLGPEETLRQAARLHSMQGATAVVLGAGAGNEADFLAPHGVKRVIGADLEAHETRWPQRRAQLAAQGINATFTLMDGANYALRDSSVDVVFSQSVLEHVVELDTALAEASRILRADGHFVAWFGPLWSTFGGSHVAELGFDHLLVSKEELLDRGRKVGDGREYWLELDLFNRMKYDDYIELLERHFVLEWVSVAGSPEATDFRDNNPDMWSRLREHHDEMDLMVRLVGVVGRPRR
jgi:SAM-dependent methyltransferase